MYIDLLLYLLVLLISLAGVALNVASLPGNWVMFLAALGLSAWHGWQKPHWMGLLLILVILLLAEVLEFVGGMIGARKFGASKSASWAAIGGALVGGIIGIPPITVAVLGIDHIVCAILGAFIAAWIVELLWQRPMGEATKAATGAALGRGMGILSKIGGGLLVWICLAILAFPWW